MEFCDLKQQYRRYQAEIDAAVHRIMESAQFIRGPEVALLEQELAAYVGVRHALACANGTDALSIALLTLGIRPGDEVIVPDFTFIATAECVSSAGAVPVFCDVREDDFMIDPALIEGKITKKTKGIIPVSLFGQCADLPAVMEIARRRGLWIIEDAAQSFGSIQFGLCSGSFADISTTSFFPSKPLGCYGDGGALFTNHDDHARVILLQANHGQTKKYVHEIVGRNSRLDTLQAAVLRVKLSHYKEEILLRDNIAARYAKNLDGALTIPRVNPGNQSTWAQYTVRSEKREAVRQRLAERGIPTMVHYPVPLHRQPAFALLPSAAGDFPVSQKLSDTVFSLPMHPFLTTDQVDEVSSAVLASLK